VCDLTEVFDGKWERINSQFQALGEVRARHVRRDALEEKSTDKGPPNKENKRDAVTTPGPMLVRLTSLQRLERGRGTDQGGRHDNGCGGRSGRTARGLVHAPGDLGILYQTIAHCAAGGS